jgi:MFS family permease
MSARLFTPRFITMFCYSVAVYLSLFQLLPAAPYRVLSIGGSTAAAGLFLGFLTYSSALSAPITGPICDRVGHRRILIVVSLVLAACTTSYAFIADHRWLLAVVVVHGLFWSALLTASSAYMTASLPPNRRAEGLSYWGLASVLSIALAPALGFWLYSRGWRVLCAELVTINLVMAFIAWRLPEADREEGEGSAERSSGSSSALGSVVPRVRQVPQLRLPRLIDVIEWRVLGLSVTMGLVSFGYGGLTSFSALFADHLNVSPRGLFLTAMAAAILVGRLTLGRHLDRLGPRRVLLPALLGPAVGLACLAMAQGRVSLAAAGIVFGAGFGLMYPAYATYVMEHVSHNRRGAAFGAMLAAFDTGVGTGSSAIGWLVQHGGYRTAFFSAAAAALLALPCFVFAERRLGFLR